MLIYGVYSAHEERQAQRFEAIIEEGFLSEFSEFQANPHLTPACMSASCLHRAWANTKTGPRGRSRLEPRAGTRAESSGFTN